MSRPAVKYTYAILERNMANHWYAQNNEDTENPWVELGPDSRLSDILTHFGDEGFIISASGGVDENNTGPTRIILVRADFGQQEPEKKESPFLGVEE